MNRAQKQHVVESLAEWGAPAVLAAAAGWAAFRIGSPAAAVALGAFAAFAVGLLAMLWMDRDRLSALSPFEAATLDAIPLADLDELLLEEKDEVLVLDDPLVEPTSDSRVVRLFVRSEPTPGELVDRISDFLGDGRRAAPVERIVAEQVVDASAALHSALANIRASLR